MKNHFTLRAWLSGTSLSSLLSLAMTLIFDFPLPVFLLLCVFNTLVCWFLAERWRVRLDIRAGMAFTPQMSVWLDDKPVGRISSAGLAVINRDALTDGSTGCWLFYQMVRFVGMTLQNIRMTVRRIVLIPFVGLLLIFLLARPSVLAEGVFFLQQASLSTWIELLQIAAHTMLFIAVGSGAFITLTGWRAGVEDLVQGAMRQRLRALFAPGRSGDITLRLVEPTIQERQASTDTVAEHHINL